MSSICADMYLGREVLPFVHSPVLMSCVPDDIWLVDGSAAGAVVVYVYVCAVFYYRRSSGCFLLTSVPFELSATIA